MFGQGYVFGSIITLIGMYAVAKYKQVSEKGDNDER